MNSDGIRTLRLTVALEHKDGHWTYAERDVFDTSGRTLSKGSCPVRNRRATDQRGAAVTKLAIHVDPRDGDDRADVLWYALMVCDDCGERVIDDRCPECVKWNTCQASHADERLHQLGVELKVLTSEAQP